VSAPWKIAALGVLVASMALAGCAGKGNSPGDTLGASAPTLAVTATTGGIRGVVVDDAVRPIAKANVAVSPGNQSAATDASGFFTFSGLAAGTYFLKVSAPLYSSAQQSVDVVAGVADPKAVKIQLQRLISQTPYIQTLKFDGYIVCSLNTPVLLSEECGEGVGVPCVAPPAPCGRVGGQSNNHIQWNIYMDSPGVASLVLEQTWDATSDAGSELYTPIGTNWVCDPNCSWDSVAEMNGPSPLYSYIGPDLVNSSKIHQGMNVTMFTWAGSFDNPAGVAVNQPFTDFATISYYLPLPQGWSFVKGDPAPF